MLPIDKDRALLIANDFIRKRIRDTIEYCNHEDWTEVFSSNGMSKKEIDLISESITELKDALLKGPEFREGN